MLDILIVGTGRMAVKHVERFSAIKGVRVLAAVDLDAERVQAFATAHDIPHAYQELDKAFSQHQFAACSVVTPDAWHAPVSIACLNAGLPVLCEKPLSDSLGQANAMVAAASQSGLMTMVNLSYRTSGALCEARRYVDEGKLGDIKHVEASYRQSWLVTDYWGDWRTEDAWLWRLSREHGSLGVLGDVGIHILDFMCAGTGQEVAGLQCRLKTFDKAPGNQIAQYTLDANDSCVMNVELSNGALGVVHMSRYYTGYMNDLDLSMHGTLGAIKVSTGQNGDYLGTCLGEDMHTQTWTSLECHDKPDTFERFVAALRAGSRPGPDFSHAAKLQHYLDLGFESHETGLWMNSQ